MQRGKPFFSGNYGSALGSTANAANLIAQAGQAQGQMFANLGKIAGESIQKYSENKKKKEEEKQTASFIKNYLKSKPDVAAQFGIKGDNLITFEEAVDQGANAIAKNPKGVESIKGLMEIQRSNAEEVRKAKAFERLIAQREGQLEMANIDLAPQPPTYTDPGGTFNANTGNRAGNRSTVEGMQSFLKNNPNLMPKTPEGKIQLANRLKDIRGANVPKPLSPSDKLAREKFEYEKRKDAKANEPMPPVDPIYKEAAINAIDTAIEKSKGFFATGITGQALQNVAGTDARDLVQAIATVEAAVGFDRLQEMRDSSKTGGALGAINTKELQLLSASLGSLDPLQKPETLRANLKSIKERYEKVLESVKAEKYAYDNDLTFKTQREAQDFIDNFNPSAETVDSSAPASQATLDELEKKRQLRSKRTGM